MGVLFLIILMIVGFVGSIIMWGRYQGKKLDAFMERQGIRNWRLDYGMGKTIISDYSNYMIWIYKNDNNYVGRGFEKITVR